MDPIQHVLEGRWKHTPLRRQGPHVRETWCAGPIACEIGWSREVPGVDWARISTILDHGAWPRVHGLYLDVGHTPRGDGWSVTIEWSRGAEPIHVDGLHVLFYRDVADASGKPGASGDDDPDGVETLSIQLGHSLQYTAYGTPIGVRAPGSPRDTLDALRGSPESLRRHGEALLDALEAKVVATIEAGELRRCIDHPSPIDGRPPICERVPLTASETQAAVDAARAALADDRERVRTEADELHALILRVLPPECL